ncbi:restriction endonuclease [Colidextribacter sp. OB.20]|uniref:BglII/BstYI family type II restriction endonuclease n=1 Tax=Colidextribacter sp. OB.20 TaxID=2304568 RepID=UPI00136D6D5A|nr:BglII/BstYI family type II restriction endonuclease [Colidextribacter sp. OB.20]NBI11134.1 restriction endonuclease [Colidextribacter sp. OB.20]
MERWKQLIPDSIAGKYEFYNFNSALEILTQSYPDEFAEIVHTLEEFEIDVNDIVEKGGNESNIPKKLNELLRPLDWKEIEISGDLIVRLLEGKKRKEIHKEFALKEFISGHKIDYVKGNVAIDMEWNSKDQTFDRDLYAFRTFYECGVITCGVIITRSESMNDIFSALGGEVKKKYGASTTWMGKLLPRIHARRHGGCPLLVVGLTPGTVSDWKDELSC